MSETATQAGAESAVRDGLRTAAERAQRDWARLEISRRLRIVASLRRSLVASADEVAGACAGARGVDAGEVYSSELLPLADACRFLERQAGRVLRVRRPGRRGQPAWLWGTGVEVVREPFGLVLILAPSNYPLFLPGVQALQALVAGNAVLVKPAPGCGAPLESLGRLLEGAGLPQSLFTVLPADPGPVGWWIRNGAALVVLTGGVETGRLVLQACAESLVPSIMELSGCDSMHVLRDAELRQVAAALAFGLRLNRGRTCIAPRRIFVQREAAVDLRRQLVNLARSGPEVPLAERTRAELRAALGAGASILCGEWREAEGTILAPLVLEGVPPESSFWTTDHFAPVALFAEVDSVAKAVERDCRCPFALGASIFGRDLEAARDLARRLPALVVTINDVVAPTADPRLPFGGSQQSGFGTTRGEEGLLALTRPKGIVKRSAGRWVPHFEAPVPGQDRALFQALHGADWRSRLAGFAALMAAQRARRRGGEEGKA